MKLPNWIPGWIAKLLGFGPALQCTTCGHIIDIEDGMAEEQAAQIAEAHHRFFHAESAGI